MKAWMKTGKLDLKRKHSESETETSKQKKTKQISESQSLKFQKSWLDEFEWLRFNSHLGSMHCATCRDTNLPSHSNKMKANAFAEFWEKFLKMSNGGEKTS